MLMAIDRILLAVAAGYRLRVLLSNIFIPQREYNLCCTV